MKKSDVIDILSQLDGILYAIDNMEISDRCTTVIERNVLNIKTIIFCESKYFDEEIKLCIKKLENC